MSKRCEITSVFLVVDTHRGYGCWVQSGNRLRLFILQNIALDASIDLMVK